MNENTKTELLEAVSALVDGESAGIELEQLISDGDQNELIGRNWKHYQLISSALRKEPHAGVDISASVSAAVASDKPDEGLLESLSALADGEAAELELRRLLKHEDNSAGIDRHWSNYHAIGHAISGEAQAGIDISTAVSAAIADESAPKTSKRFFKPLSQFAVAASVAGLALFGVSQFQVAQQDGVSGGEGIAETQATENQVNENFTAPPGFETRPQTSLVGTNASPRPVESVEKVEAPIQYNHEELSQHIGGKVEQHSQDSSELSQDYQPLLRVPVEE